MPDEPALLPLFPLQTVLFPGSVLPLRVFEARYMDMAARCLRDDSVFGVNLIAEGSEVGKPARPFEFGVSARIRSCDMTQPGLLHLVAWGERRYRVRRTEEGPNGLLLAEVDWVSEPAECKVPDDCAGLVALLRAIIEDVGAEHFPEPYRLDDAGWVGMRLASVLPIPMRARQGLLELNEPLDRLEVIRTYMEQQGLKKA